MGARRGGMMRLWAARTAMAVVMLGGSAMDAAGPVDAGAHPAGTWNNQRAELFIVDIVEPTLAAGGPTGALTANVVNRGPLPADNVRLTYTVPTGLTYVGATLAGGSCSYASPTVTCTLLSLSNNAKAAIAV